MTTGERFQVDAKTVRKWSDRFLAKGETGLLDGPAHLGWAHIRPWTSEAERAARHAGFAHFCDNHRSRGALGWATATNLLRDNLPEEHS